MVAARWNVARRRLDAASPSPVLYFAPGTTPVTETEIADEAAQMDEEAQMDQEEDNRLELSFEDGGRVLGEISDLVGEEIGSDRVADASALVRALEDIRAGFDRSMVEATDDLLPAGILTAEEDSGKHGGLVIGGG